MIWTLFGPMIISLLGNLITPAMMQKLLGYIVKLGKSVAAKTGTTIDDKMWEVLERLSTDPNILQHLADWITALMKGKETPPVIDPLNPPVVDPNGNVIPGPVPTPRRGLIRKIWNLIY